MDRVTAGQASGPVRCLGFLCRLLGTVPVLLRLGDGVVELRQCVVELGLGLFDGRDRERPGAYKRRCSAMLTPVMTMTAEIFSMLNTTKLRNEARGKAAARWPNTMTK